MAMKKRYIFMLIVMTALAATGRADAACYGDYKAKQDNPLRLHYGVIELPDAACDDPALARAEIKTRIAVENWRLLNILSVFGENGLENRKESAGQFFLRF